MFDSFELSRFLGKPIHLFLFTRQGLSWRLASCDRDVVVGDNTYAAAQISRSEIKQTVERAKDKITISMAYLRDPDALAYPSTQALGDNWFPYVPSDTIYVVCMSTHFGNTDPPIVEWMGQVTQPKFSDVELQLTCEPSGDQDKARFQGPKWQRACWKTVYSTGLSGCNLDPDAFKVDGTLTAVAGVVVSADEFADAPLNLAGGKLTWTRDDGLVERRSIMAHSGTSITLLYGAADLAAGLAVTALPGCARTWAACTDRDNTDNYGSAIYKPVNNPTQGVSMSWG